MNRNAGRFLLLLSPLVLTTCILSFAQDAPCPAKSETPPHQTKADDEPALALASAERVYLNARLGATVNSGSGRGYPSSDRAFAELKIAIADWQRFAIVSTPDQSDLILTIVEGSRNSGVRVGVLTEKLLVTRGGSKRIDSPSLWESSLHDGGVRNYRPVANTVSEFRAIVEEYEKKFPKELISQTRAARNANLSFADCGPECRAHFDCLAHSSTALFLPNDREENKGAVKLSEAVLNVSPLDMEARVPSSDFSNYVVAIQKLLHRQFTSAERQAGWDLAVVGTLQGDGKAKIGLQSRPVADQQSLQTVYDNLSTVSSPAVKGDPLEFRIVFSVWGGSEESKAEN